MATHQHGQPDRSAASARTQRPSGSIPATGLDLPMSGERAGTLIRGQNEVLRMIAAGEPLPKVLHRLLETIEHDSPDMLTSILLADPERGRLRHLAAPSLSEEYCRATDAIIIGPHSGACGTAAFRGEPVACEDVARDPLWETHRDIALRHGLRACWSTPIFGAERALLGTFAVYYREVRAPDPAHQGLVELATQLAAIAIEWARSENILHHEQAMLASTQQRAHVGLWELHLGSQRMYWSRELYHLLRRDPAAGPPSLEEFLEYLHPEDRETVVEAYEHLTQLARPERVDFRSNPALGPLRYYSATMDMVSSGDAANPVATGTIMDVSDRRRSEQALRDSEERLRLALRAADQGLFDWDLRTGIAEVSMEYVHLLEEDPVDFGESTTRWLARIAPDDVDRVTELYEDCMRGKSAGFSAEYRIRTGSGAWRWIQSIGQVVARDTEGRPVRLLGVITDITCRKTAEEALRNSEERYRKLIEEARDAVLVLDAAGHIQSLNAAFETITGAPRRRWLGRHYLELVHPDNRDNAQVVFNDVLSGRVPPPFEVQLISATGSFVQVELSLTARTEAGTINGMLGIARDITERRQLETQLRHVQRMDSIGQLAGGIAHDFNNILTVIQGNASLLRSLEGLPQTAADSVYEIHLAAERASSLTRQLLAFSRRQVLQPVDVDLNEIVNRYAGMLGRVLGENIHLRIRLDPRPPLIHADAGMLEQVLLNLAVNARDAMPGGGTLTITTSHVVADAAYVARHPEAAVGHFACLSVADTGCGISTEHLPRIFDPFFTTKPAGKGMGLGLATVFGIVRQHRGWIQVHSAPESGSTFHIHLPAVEAVATHPQPPVQEPADVGGSETILLVEDESHVRATVSDILERHGYHVVAVENGPAALRKWHDHATEIDLLITDIVMPEGMTGYDLADRIREDRGDLPVLFCSGYHPESLAQRRKPDPRSSFLQKPFDLERLLRTLRDCLDA